MGPEENNRSEECTSQVASRPCANGFHGKWVKKCKLHSSDNSENLREPRQRQDENEVLPISELFDMAASPVRKLLNTYNFENGEIIDLETTTSTTTTKSQTEQPSTYFEGGAQKRKFKDSSQRTPLSTKDVMVLNQRSMLVAKFQDETEIENLDDNTEDNVVIVTAKTISGPDSKKGTTYFDPIFSVGRQGGQATTRSASTSGFKWVLIDLNTTPDTPKPIIIQQKMLNLFLHHHKHRLRSLSYTVKWTLLS